jgi:hypothetical protein
MRPASAQQLAGGSKFDNSAFTDANFESMMFCAGSAFDVI